MAKSAGVIQIQLQAGTANFIRDMDAAGAKVRSFGTEARKSGEAAGRGFNFRYAFFGLKDVMEGRTKYAIAELSNELVSMGGKALMLGGIAGAFAAIGFVVFELRNHLREMREEPEKLAAAFAKVGNPIRLANDELRVSNDRLENEIAKLEGRRQNTIKIALDEARVAADKLAEALDKDLTALHKVLQEQGTGALKGLIFGKAGTSDVTELVGRLTGSVATVTEQFNGKIAGAKTPDEQKALRAERDRRLENLYQAALDDIDKKLKAPAAPSVSHMLLGMATMDPKEFSSPEDSAGRREQLKHAAGIIRRQMEFISLQETNTDLKQRKPQAEQDSHARETINHLNGELARARAAEKEGIERVNAEELIELENLRQKNELNSRTTALVHEIYNVKRLTVFNEELQKYNELLEQSRHSMAAMVTEGQKLSAHAFTPDIEAGEKTLKERGESIARLVREYNKLSTESANASVRHRERMIGIEGAGDDPLLVLSRQQEVGKDEIEKRYQQALKESNSELERANAIKTRDLELDQLAYEYLERQAELRQRTIGDFFREMQRESESAGQIFYNAMHSALDRTSDQLARLFSGQKTSFGAMLQDIGHEMEKSAIKSLLQRGLGALGKVFGIDVGKGKPDGTAANPLHVRVMGGAPVPVVGGGIPGIGGIGGGDEGPAPDRPHGIKGILGSIGSIFIGGGQGKKGGVVKTALGAITGQVGGGRPDGTQGNPYYVVMSQGGRGKSGLGALGSMLPEGMGGALGKMLGKLGGFVGKLFGGGGHGLTESVTSSISFGGPMAEGGYVSPSEAYLVGENGPELFRPGASGHIINNSAMRRDFGGHTANATYVIDARNAELGAENRIQRSIEVAHAAAVSNSVRVNAERTYRTPQRTGTHG